MMAPISDEKYASVLRKIAWDVLPCDDVLRYMTAMDLVPSSAEGAEMEHKDSHNRMGLQQPLQDRLPVYSEMAARVLAALALRLDQSPEPDNIVAMVNYQFAQTIHVGTSVIIANMLEEGYLQLGPKVSK